MSEIALMNMDRIPHGKAGFGSTVTIREKDQEMVYQLVMPEDAEAEKGLISTSSPIGRAILNKEEGDEHHRLDAERHPQVRNPEARHHPRRSGLDRRIHERR